MKENKMKVVVKEVNKPCEVREITNDYKAFQGIVEGLYEITQMPNREDIDMPVTKNICSMEWTQILSCQNMRTCSADRLSLWDMIPKTEGSIRTITAAHILMNALKEYMAAQSADLKTSI